MGILKFGLLGLGTGGVYAVLGIGLVVVFRASGVLNFAAGAIGALAAFVFYDLRDTHHVNWIVALVVGLAIGALAGVVTHGLVIARLRHASALARLIATLGVMTSLQALALVEWGSSTRLVGSILPTRTLKLTSQLTITEDRLILLISAIVLAVGLKLIYAYTDFGLATSAVAENRRAASSSGWSTSSIEVVNWAVGGALSALATIFIAGITGLTVGTLVLIVLPALAAALIGGFNSFMLTLAGAMIIGVTQAEMARYVRTQGLSDAVPFIIIVLVIVAGGRARPTRADLPTRLPLPGDGRINWPLLILGASVGMGLVWGLGPVWISALTTTFIFGIVVLSVVVVTGFGGQLSLGQWAIAGMGAWIASQLVATVHLPFWAAGSLGVLLTIPAGLIVALPALRTRGVNLAVATLGLAEVITAVVLQSQRLTGGTNGVKVGALRLFGINFDPTRFAARYAALVLVVFVLTGLAVANVRRGRVGRRLLAVRSDERAAAAVGVGVYGVKLYAFGLAAAVAAIAGILAAWRTPIVVFDQFDVFTSIVVVMFAVIGGIGWASGSVFGGTLAAGSIVALVYSKLFGSNINAWLPLLTGIFVVFNLSVAPDGMASLHKKMVAPTFDRIRRSASRLWPASAATRDGVKEAVPAGRYARPHRVPASLEVKSLSVRYGGVQALDEVSFRVEPGEVVGLIGPNGAGKTTLLDAVTGFTKPSAGTVLLNGRKIVGWSPVRINRAGVSRSFQAVQLFDSMTVRENLLTAIDSDSWIPYVTDLVHPERPLDTMLLDEIVHEFELANLLDRRPSELPHGTARLVGVARALLCDPAVLFLDEPAAGLDASESAELVPLIRRIAAERQVAVVLVEHDVPLVLKTCDRIVVLDFGREIAHGSPEEIRRDPAVIAAYLGADHDEEAQPVSVAETVPPIQA